MSGPGRIVVLNGAPRSGKSSIARAVMARLPGAWVNIGVDSCMRQTPPELLPGIGLRPGGERPDLEPHLPGLYAALYRSIAETARSGVNVVVDIGHHDFYSRPLGILPASARQLQGLPALLVGVRCPVAVNLARRQADSRAGFYSLDPEIAARWEKAVHEPGIYDLELDTSGLSPEAAADRIAASLADPPLTGAFTRLAQG